jgi:hypothetical protein
MGGLQNQSGWYREVTIFTLPGLKLGPPGRPAPYFYVSFNYFFSISDYGVRNNKINEECWIVRDEEGSCIGRLYCSVCNSGSASDI